MSTLVIEFKHGDVMEPRPWPIGINDDNIVAYGLGEDDGASWVGFARKDEQAFFALPTAFPDIDFESQDIVPVFANNGTMFNWNIAIQSIRAVEA